MPGSRPTQFSTPRPNALSDPSFDRAAHRRLDDAWLAAARTASEIFVVPVWQSQPLILAGEGGNRGVLLPARDFDWGIAGETVFLGFSDGRGYFAVDISALPAEEATRRFGHQGAFLDLWRNGQTMPREEASLLAYAKGILWWNARHRFCGVCGHPTLPNHGGHRRVCTNPDCKTEQFPRSDPAVIVLIEHEDRCLLARDVRFPPGIVSVLAGFVEPGESLEDTVAREVFEEVGVRVEDIVYRSSQPWPFPSSLMVGFRARALDAKITIDPTEIAEADWYSRDWLRALPGDGSIRLPPKFSIAGCLIEDWVNDG